VVHSIHEFSLQENVPFTLLCQLYIRTASLVTFAVCVSSNVDSNVQCVGRSDAYPDKWHCYNQACMGLGLPKYPIVCECTHATLFVSQNIGTRG